MKKSVMKFSLVSVFVLQILIGFSFINYTPQVSYKCMIQMTNYTGEKAYVFVSLMDKDNKYVKTLYMQGDDPEWFPDIKEWWTFSNGTNENIDGLSGATIGNGERNIISLGFTPDQIDNGYKLRFESSVENQEYYAVDAEIPLNTETIKNKVEGKGYIRFIRMVPNK